MKIKSLALIPLVLMLAIFISSFPKERSEPDYECNLAICAIFRDEARFLKEWIEFHLLVGVQRFYLHNNLSSDEYLEVLTPYINKGIVELVNVTTDHSNNFDWNNIQCETYSKCVKKVAKKVKWLAFIDVDEYIVPVEHDSLVELLKDYEEYSGLCINWQQYGTSDVEKIQPGQLMTELLTCKAKENHHRNHLVKSIVRPEYISHFSNPHFAIYKKGFCVNSAKELYSYSETKEILIDKVRINHYFLRDLTYFREVKLPRYAKRELEHIDGCPEESLTSNLGTFNAIHDPIMERFTPKFQEAMR